MSLAAEPSLQRPALVSARGWQLLVADPVRTIGTLSELDRYATAIGWRDDPEEGPPFRGGAVGMLGEDLSSGFLRLGRDARPAAVAVPRLRFTVHTWAVALDPEGQGWIISDTADAARLTRLLKRPAAPAAPFSPGPRLAQAGLTRQAHAAAVARILEWIAAGDLYQANLTFQIAAPWQHTAVQLAARLWDATPGAGHAALMPVDDATTVVSASPETFLRTSGDSVVTRPIKGTRRRHTDPDRDAASAAELSASAKDAAEHVMIVDLMRNDLGKVCRTGTVQVPDHARLERHPTVWHLTSTVEGRLRPDVRLADLLAATFPPGSVTGAPKRMAVARTREVEPVRRGAYCGAVGLISPGTIELSVAIRTAVVGNGMASYGTGGGIVADSRSDDEYDEALAKAAAFLAATSATLA